MPGVLRIGTAAVVQLFRENDTASHVLHRFLHLDLEFRDESDGVCHRCLACLSLVTRFLWFFSVPLKIPDELILFLDFLVKSQSPRRSIPELSLERFVHPRQAFVLVVKRTKV